MLLSSTGSKQPKVKPRRKPAHAAGIKKFITTGVLLCVFIVAMSYLLGDIADTVSNKVVLPADLQKNYQEQAQDSLHAAKNKTTDPVIINNQAVIDSAIASANAPAGQRQEAGAKIMPPAPASVPPAVQKEAPITKAILQPSSTGVKEKKQALPVDLIAVRKPAADNTEKYRPAAPSRPLKKAKAISKNDAYTARRLDKPAFRPVNRIKNNASVSFSIGKIPK